MPYVNLRLIDDQISAEKKLAIIEGFTNVLVEVLGKDPATTFVVIDEVPSENWGIYGTSVTERRKAREKNEK